MVSNNLDRAKLFIVAFFVVILYLIPENAGRIYIGATEGINSLRLYISANLPTVIVPSFFLMGSVAVMMPRPLIKKNMQVSRLALFYCLPGALMGMAFSPARVVLPLFIVLYYITVPLGFLGAFLFSSALSGMLITPFLSNGTQIFPLAVRAIAIIFMSAGVGFLFHLFCARLPASIFSDTGKLPDEYADVPLHTPLIHIGTLIAIMFFLNISQFVTKNNIWLHLFQMRWYFISFLATVFLMTTKFEMDGELKREWLNSSLDFGTLFVPPLLAGALAAGFFFARTGYEGFIPQNWLDSFFLKNSFPARFFIAFYGALTNLDALGTARFVSEKSVEMPSTHDEMVKTFAFASQMLSLPLIMILGRVLGVARMSVYCLMALCASVLWGYLPF